MNNKAGGNYLLGDSRVTEQARTSVNRRMLKGQMEHPAIGYKFFTFTLMKQGSFTMKTYSKVLCLVVLMFGLAQQGFAAGWVNTLTVSGTHMGNPGSGPFLSFAVVEPISTGCGTSDTWRYFTMVVSGNAATEPSGMMKMFLSQLLAAKASGNKVSVYVTGCDANGSAVFNQLQVY